MRRRQRGGALEPTRKVPAFKYTDDPKRREHIAALYPYSSYFASILKEIPWSKFRSEREGFTAVCNEVPYFIFGGAAYEAYDQMFPTMTPRLHDVVDPTSDIDVYISPLVIQTLSPNMKNKMYGFTITDDDDDDAEECKDKEGNELQYTPIYEDYTQWLYSQLAEKIRNLSYNFPEWFDVSPIPLTNEQVKEHDPESACVTEIIQVHPMYVMRKIYPERGIKIQISFYNGESLKDFMECLFHTPSKINTPTVFPDCTKYRLEDLMMTPDGIRLNCLSYELDLQEDSIRNRIILFSDIQKQYRYKILNHIFRLIYLLGIIEQTLQRDPQPDSPLYDAVNSELRRILLNLVSISMIGYPRNVKESYMPSIKQTIQDLTILPQIVTAICSKPTILNIIMSPHRYISSVDHILQEYGCPVNPTKKIKIGGRRKTHRRSSRQRITRKNRYTR